MQQKIYVFVPNEFTFINTFSLLVNPLTTIFRTWQQIYGKSKLCDMEKQLPNFIYSTTNKFIFFRRCYFPFEFIYWLHIYYLCCMNETRFLNRNSMQFNVNLSVDVNNNNNNSWIYGISRSMWCVPSKQKTNTFDLRVECKQLWQMHLQLSTNRRIRTRMW